MGWTVLWCRCTEPPQLTGAEEEGDNLAIPMLRL